MRYIAIGYDKDDRVFEEILSSQFGDVIHYDVKGFGGEWLLVVLIPIVEVSIQLVDFFLTYFKEKRPSNKSKFETNNLEDNHAIKRCLITPDRHIYLENYSGEEIKELLEREAIEIE